MGLDDTRKEQRHLLGAYSFAVNDPIDLAQHGLLQAGVWNYLREEITVALECRRPVRISSDFQWPTNNNIADDMQANIVTYVLARIINFCFVQHTETVRRISEWKYFTAALHKWRDGLPPSFSPFSMASKPGNVFPSLWMLRPWHGMLCPIILHWRV